MRLFKREHDAWDRLVAARCAWQTRVGSMPDNSPEVTAATQEWLGAVAALTDASSAQR